MAEESLVSSQLRQGIAAVKAGEVRQARELLLQVLDLDSENEQAWLWMSAVSDGEDRITCLKNVLSIDPQNEYARLGLQTLLREGGPVAREAPTPATAAPSVPAAESPPAEVASLRTVRTSLRFLGLGVLAVLTVTVCGVALALGGMVAARGAWLARPTIMSGQIVPPSPAPALDSVPAPTSITHPSPTPTGTRAPVPTNTLVVPNARIPGFPIVSEGAYDEIEGRVCELRGLGAVRDVPMVTFTRYRLEDYLYDMYRGEEYARELEVSQKVYRLLGLIDEDYELVQESIRSQREGLAGLYDTEEGEIYLILDRYTSDLWLEVTFAHEFAHALQDQHFDLSALQSQTETTDSSLALQALIEGDATLVMTEYAFEHLFGIEFDRDLLRAIQEVEQGEYQDAPGIVRETGWFPYDQGTIFAAALVEEGGWAQMDRAFRDPPRTTEQIMHPDKYMTGELARIPEVGDLLAEMGPRWVERRRDVLGELFIRAYLERELSSEEALMAGEGWEGDRLVFVETEDQDRYGLVLRTTWDSTANSEEFFSFFLTFMHRTGARSGPIDAPQRRNWQEDDQITYLSRQGQDILLVLTSDEETMSSLLTGFPAF